MLDGGHTTTYAFEPGSATDVVLAQLEIRNYTSGYERAAIMSNPASSGWTLDDLLVHDNGTDDGGSGLAVGPHWQVLGGRYYDNRQDGLASAYGTGATVDGVEIDHNNFTDDSYTTANVSCDDEAGGFKWVADDVTVRNSNVHHNACVGLWVDVLRGRRHRQPGPRELGRRHLRRDLARRDRDRQRRDRERLPQLPRHAAPGSGGGGITLASSDHAVRSPTTSCRGNCNGITGTQQNRSDGNPGLLEDANIHDNVIVGPGGKTGAAVYPVSIANLLLRDITFAGNTITNGMSNCGLQCLQPPARCQFQVTQDPPNRTFGRRSLGSGKDTTFSRRES